ncbi:hypothetical protein FPV67DRAFT_1444763 [Lyophyllum atratum]|nr:hypothetical protein FPV67DRAFT_1444763 [Lyophyllum atratum]
MSSKALDTASQRSGQAAAPPATVAAQANEIYKPPRARQRAIPQRLSSAQICRNFLLGQCPHGDGCRFVHKEPQGKRAEEVGTANTSRDQARTKKSLVAVYDETGGSHERNSVDRVQLNGSKGTAVTNKVHITVRIPSSQTQSYTAFNVKKPCYDWKAGKCFRGDKCRYSHDQGHTTGTEDVRSEPCASSTRPGGRKAPIRTQEQWDTERLLAFGTARLADQAEAARILETERLEAERKARLAEQEAVQRAQETERLEAIRTAQAEAKAAQRRQAEERRAGRLAREAEREKKRRAAEEAARIRETERLEAIRTAQAEAAARKRQAEEKRAAWLAREAEREKKRQAAEEAARIREAKRLEAEQEAAQRREARAREEAAREALRIETEAAFTTQHIVLGSTLVTCGAGLEVRGVVGGFQSCRLTIHNLPGDAKASEIAELFTNQGISRHDIHILSIQPTTGGRLEAKVATSSAEGAAIAIGLDGIGFRNETLQFEVSENASIGAMGESSARQADTLTITWFAPSTSMIATYSTMDDARAMVVYLDKEVISGRRIKAEMNQPPTGPALRYYNPSSVKITGLPVDVPIDTVVAYAGTASIRAIKSNMYDLPEALRVLRDHLERLPNSGMNSFDHAGQDVDGRLTIRVRFESWDHAQRARDSLEGKRLRPDHPYFRLSLPQPLHFISIIPVQQYDAQKRLWDSLADTKHDKGPRVHINRVPERGIVRIRLSGDDKKAVGALKVRVETLVAGEKLDATYWHRSFLWAKGREFLTKVFKETGVYARADFKVQALKIYGEGEAGKNARQLIEEEVARLAQLEWTILLKRQTVGYFVRKGLAALKEVLGEDAVTLDLGSTPCKLTFRGGEEARHALGTLMDQSLNDLDMHTSAAGDDICPICYDTVSHPVKLACMGNEANCKVAIPIPVIQRFLIQQQYEHLVNVVFSTYLDQHPLDFKYCTTPDCTQIYRANTKTMLKCPSCFAEVCSSCHEEAHEGMTCEERRIRKSQEEEQLNDNWATMHGVKRCPACRVWIEKIDGCNHMTCNCGAHVCWICMQIFPQAQIYTHLGDVHGGAYDEDRERRNNDLQHALALQRQLDQPRDANPPPQDPGRVHVRQPAPAVRPPAALGAALHHFGQAPAGVEADRLDRVGEYHRQLLAHRQQQQREALEAEAEHQRRQVRQQAEQRRLREEYQRQFDERQARLLREAQERRRQEGGWGCTVM